MFNAALFCCACGGGNITEVCASDEECCLFYINGTGGTIENCANYISFRYVYSSETCVNSDNGATDSDGDGCAAYIYGC